MESCHKQNREKIIHGKEGIEMRMYCRWFQNISGIGDIDMAKTYNRRLNGKISIFVLTWLKPNNRKNIIYGNKTLKIWIFIAASK